MSSLHDGIDAQLGAWRSRLTWRLHPVLDRHHRNLAALAVSLEAAGHAPEVVAACVRDLLDAYEADLLQALAAPDLP